VVLAVFRVAFFREPTLIIKSTLSDGQIVHLNKTSHGGQLIMAKVAKKAPTKTEILQNIANATDLSKKQVAAVLDAMTEEVRKNLGPRGIGIFTIPGLLKIEKKKVPARPAQKGVLNPFTKELQDRPAKPAYNKVKLRALRSLKEMALK
jgi:nucleoid DNA-binding protein